MYIYHDNDVCPSVRHTREAFYNSLFSRFFDSFAT